MSGAVIMGPGWSSIMTPNNDAKSDASTSCAGETGPHLPNPTSHAAISFPERRQLTVLFCDLVDSTALSRQLDPEDLTELLRVYQDTCAQVIERFKGFTAQYLGDGILSYFGYPQAHEDDAERAVHAALEMLDAARGITFKVHGEAVEQLAVRIGIATGLVVAGDMAGIGAGGQISAWGETPNLAARLQSAAEPNTVVIAPNTRTLIGELFDCENLGTSCLKGYEEPVELWRVVRARKPESRFEAVHASTVSSLIGRDTEMARLLSLWRQVQQGRGQVVVLSGEPGIGKSCLAWAFRERIRSDAPVRVGLQCSPYHTHSALYPFIAYLERASEIAPQDTAQAKLSKLGNLLSGSTKDLDTVVSLFAELLAIPTAGLDPPLRLNPQQKRADTLRAFVEQLDALAAQSCMLVLFEDVHWIDPTSLELLHLLAERVYHSRVMLLVTARPEFTPFAEDARVTWLEVHRLDRHQATRLVGQVAKDRRLPREVVHEVVAKSDGIPLFIEELTNALIASKESDSLAGTSSIPMTLKDSLMARIDQLAPYKEVAQVGAVIGREFSYDLLARVCGLDDTQLNKALERLTQSELVFENRRRSRAARGYVFKHALVQDAAYDSVLKRRRRALHARTASVLEHDFPQQVAVAPELLARHYTEAERPEAAVPYWIKAGQVALDRSANLEALSHSKRGLKVIGTLPDSNQRAHQELALQVNLGAAYRAIKGFSAAEVERTFTRAAELCHTVGSTEELVEVHRGLFSCYYGRGALDSALEQALQVFSLARATGSPRPQMLGHWMTGCVRFWQGAFLSARDGLERACAVYDMDGSYDTALSHQIDPKANAMLHLCWTLWILGYSDQAVRKCEETIALAQELSQPFTLAMALFWASVTTACCGYRERSAAFRQSLRQVTDDRDLAYLGACATVLEGHELIAEGDHAGGLARMRDAFTEFQSQNAGLGRPWAFSLPIAASIRIGQCDQARALLNQASNAMEANGERHWEAEIYRLEAELLQILDPPDCEGAEQRLQQAIRRARAQGAKSLELRAATALAHLLLAQGRQTEAQRELAAVYTWFTEGFDTVDVMAAEAVLNACSGSQ